ncbi:hypothetical protein ACFYYI_17780 [Streptomyces sp. NPDC002387]|uniref:hypothetical protein n=1 Tax=unclassified Streptomyces TaxID=2593676 RepID=UPI00341FF0A8
MDRDRSGGPTGGQTTRVERNKLSDRRAGDFLDSRRTGSLTAHHPKPDTGITVSSGQCGGGVTKRHFDVNLAAMPPTLAAKPEIDDFTGKVVSPAVNFGTFHMDRGC